jgi:formylglycine-generating enzyme required for sulfatase activity
MNLELFADGARRALHAAHVEAQRLQHSYLRPEHIVLGLLKMKGGITGDILESQGLDPNRLAEDLESLLGEGPQKQGQIRLSIQGRRFLSQAVADARKRGEQQAGEVHLLRALIEESKREEPGLLMVLGVDVEALSSKLVDNPAKSTASPGRVLADSPSKLSLGDRSVESSVPAFLDDVWWLPNEPALGFMLISEGSFWMGSEGSSDHWSYPEEEPEHEVFLPSFYISRYPVTVLQFKSFVEDSAYRLNDPASIAGPHDHPVTRVSWKDALAYCAWLSFKLRNMTGLPDAIHAVLSDDQWQIVLPSEAEWEKAARGTDRRLFPWGDEASWRHANCAEARLGTTSPVGSHSIGTSPYGLQDMSGNVWEWTRSLWGVDPQVASFRYPYDSRDGREDTSASDDICRIMRGAGFLDSIRHGRCASRAGGEPDGIDNDIGFRIALSPIPSTLDLESLAVH